MNYRLKKILFLFRKQRSCVLRHLYNDAQGPFEDTENKLSCQEQRVIIGHYKLLLVVITVLSFMDHLSLLYSETALICCNSFKNAL
jgi:hypothetical protein